MPLQPGNQHGNDYLGEVNLLIISLILFLQPENYFFEATEKVLVKEALVIFCILLKALNPGRN